MSKTKKPEPLYTWVFQSSQPRNGGEYVHYITQLNPDWTLSCNCPGWVFAKKGQPRHCKHTDDPRVQEQLPIVKSALDKGHALDMIDMSGKKVVASSLDNLPTAEKKPSIRCGRVLEV